MDRPLESGRERDQRDHPYGGGGGGRPGGHYGGGGGYHGNHHRGRGRGRGRGGFRGRGRGRGRGRHHNNRHHRNNRNNDGNNDYEDPNARLIKQLSVMVSRVGEFRVPAGDSAAAGDASTESSLRPVVLAGAKNISDLTKVVSKDSNVATFLKFVPPPPPPKKEENSTGFGFQRPPPKPEEQAGPMAHLIVSCASTLPLQTPCYAALTLSVHAHSNIHHDYAGFANRCMNYAMQRLSYDMDTLFCATAPGTAEQRPKIACRIKLLLRYMAMLGQLKVIQAQDGDDSVPVPSEEEEDSSTKSYSMLGFLQYLVEAAVAAAPTDDAFGTTSSSNAAAPLILVYFILSTIPYLLSYIPPDVIQEHLLDPLQTLLGAYASSFTPGVGMTAILLKDEQLEGGDEEEEEEDDDDDEEETSEVVCDSLQDLNRSVQLLIKEHSDDKPPATSFALLTDEPWKGILGPEVPPPPQPAGESAMDTGSNVKMEEGAAIKTDPDQPAVDAETTTSPAAPPGPLVHPDPPMRLKMPEGSFQSLNLLMNSKNSDAAEEEGTNTTPPKKIQAFPLEVVVFGRLPFFGGPQPASGDGEEQDDDDMDDDDAPANDQIAAYSKEFGVLDRCFLADAIRDLLCCHESSVSATGLERGNAKSVAEQLWSLGHVFAATGDASSAQPVGLEYGILEAILSLILQSSHNSTFRQIYLSRVLLELTRLQPALVSPALALGVSNLFQDYVPALVPPARRNLSCLLSFHLANTDYQWPTAYWSHWQTYAVDSNKLLSRGVVVRNTLQFLTENVNNPSIVVKDCLPSECTGLVNEVVPPLPPAETGEETIDSIEKEIRRRIWDDDEHPETLKGYMIGEELSETLSSLPLDDNSSLKRVWCRSGVVLRSLMQAAEREHQRLVAAVEQAKKKAEENGGNNEDDNAMEEDDDLSEDTQAVLLEALSRYGPALAGAVGKDKEIAEPTLQGSENGGNLLSAGGAYLASILGEKAGFSRAVLEGCLDCLLQQGVITGSGALRWALGDVPNLHAQPKVVERWWEHAADAIRAELVKQKSNTTAQPPAEEGGMVIDRTGEGGMDAEAGSASKTTATVESLSALLDYTVRRACTLLTEQPDDPQQGNKLKPLQVDLIEGVKFYVRAAYGLCFSELRKSNENESGVTEREIQDALAQSTIAGWKLAGVCQEFSSSHAVDVLRESLGTV